MKPLLILLLAISPLFVLGQQNRALTIVAYDTQINKIIYDHTGPSVFKLPKIQSVSKRWISDHWNYNNVIKFEDESKLVFRGNTDLDGNNGNVRYRISIDVKDEKFRVIIDDVTYYKPILRQEVPFEYILAKYIEATDELKKLVEKDTEKLSRGAEKSHRRAIDYKRMEAERYRTTLYYANVEFEKYIKSLTYYLITNSDW